MILKLEVYLYILDTNDNLYILYFIIDKFYTDSDKQLLSLYEYDINRTINYFFKLYFEDNIDKIYKYVNFSGNMFEILGRTVNISQYKKSRHSTSNQINITWCFR